MGESVIGNIGDTTWRKCHSPYEYFAIFAVRGCVIMDAEVVRMFFLFFAVGIALAMFVGSLALMKLDDGWGRDG